MQGYFSTVGRLVRPIIQVWNHVRRMCGAVRLKVSPYAICRHHVTNERAQLCVATASEGVERLCVDDTRGEAVTSHAHCEEIGAKPMASNKGVAVHLALEELHNGSESVQG